MSLASSGEGFATVAAAKAEIELVQQVAGTACSRKVKT